MLQVGLNERYGTHHAHFSLLFNCKKIGVAPRNQEPHPTLASMDPAQLFVAEPPGTTVPLDRSPA